MKKKIVMFGLLLLISATLSGCKHEHVWNEATCIEPKTCTECGETDGNALDHTWIEATCTEPKTCSVCGESEGNALEHAWQDATCTEPKTCSICGESEGDTIPHVFNDEGICTMCQLKKIALTWENVGDYLQATYNLENSGSNYRITVTVAPVSNHYTFQDAQVHIGMNLYEESGDENHLLYDVPLDFDLNNREQFYDLDNEGNLTIEGHFPTNYNLDDLRPVQIYDARGFCIKK